MPNNVHLLVYQHQSGALSMFMRSLMTSYSRYFNSRHKRTGTLFESRYKASLISDDSLIWNISPAISILNPKHWREYEYSSLPYYLQQVSDVVVCSRNVFVNIFPGPDEYLHFMEDYDENKKMLDILKRELADET